mmetsp:Transcript_35936/g.55209  ORF Transcript_35936/g.55209 Transcript_35936/m.55209 type:complete len:170 (-) Transcript_35936:3-512(-)
MLFGINSIDFILFIIIVSFAEALYAPMINVFTFNFTKEGREGTFLTLTAAPVYFTMALTGIVGGYLLENYYPAKEDATHKRKPEFIWITIIVFSLSTFLALYFGRDYFNASEEEEEAPLSTLGDSSINEEPHSVKQLRNHFLSEKGGKEEPLETLSEVTGGDPEMLIRE